MTEADGIYHNPFFVVEKRSDFLGGQARWPAGSGIFNIENLTF